MRAKVSVLSLFLLLCVFFLGTAQAQESKWFDMSDFDPFGHALNNVEEAVPGLWLKGIIWNDTGVFLNGRGDQYKSSAMRGNPTPPGPGAYNSNPGAAFGNRKRNWVFEKIEWFTELEARYVPPGTPQVEINSVWDFRYNALYDWDHSFKRNFGPASGALRRNLYPALKEADEYYNDTKRIWREFFIKWTPPGWIIELGKQQHIWAKVDTKVHDDVFAIDQRYGTSGANPRLTQTDYEYVNIPTWMLSVTRQIGTNYYFQLIWNFDYERNYFYPGGYVWNTGLSPLDNIGFNPAALTTRYHADMPTWNIKDHEWIMRLGFMIDRWNGHLFYAYVWDKNLTPFRRAFRVVGGLPHYYVEPKPTRLHYIGLSLDTNFWLLERNWAMFFENYLLLNKYIPTLTESVLALGLTSPLLNKYDGVTKRNLYKHVWGVQSYFMRDFSFLVYWSFVNIFGRDGGIPAPQFASPKPTISAFFLPAITYTAPWTEDRWFISWINEITMFENVTGQQVVSTGYTFSNYLKALVTFHYFFGDSSDAPWGRWNDQSYVEFKIKYEF